jgi:hypothetical protein
MGADDRVVAEVVVDQAGLVHRGLEADVDAPVVQPGDLGLIGTGLIDSPT